MNKETLDEDHWDGWEHHTGKKPKRPAEKPEKI